MKYYTMKLTNLNKTWDFVEMYYPNYYSSPTIDREYKLNKLLLGEYAENDSAYELLVSEYGGDIENIKIMQDWVELQALIYAKAIEEYIKTQKENND
jgi:hypothetical protein